MSNIQEKIRASRNRTMTVANDEKTHLKSRLITLNAPANIESIKNKTIYQDIFEAIPYLPNAFIDLLFIDPPYNLTKTFNVTGFKKTDEMSYQQWAEEWLTRLLPKLKGDASVYICCDWQSSNAIYNVLNNHLKVRNRITWEREKGRGAKSNWKNCSEDIWFATVSDKYHFNPDAVKLKRKVIAPYRTSEGAPKDWAEEENGNYRLTHPSNIWTDLTIPFWSMPENTDHPTQKPEKLVAKAILASSKEGDIVFDPFLGSGTTSVVAKKLNRNYCGVELDMLYCLLTEKRIDMADDVPTIQGYKEDVFWERNSLSDQSKSLKKMVANNNLMLIPNERLL